MSTLRLNVGGLVWVLPGWAVTAGPWVDVLNPGLTVLVGGDGTGKSTRLRLLAAVQPPAEGQLVLFPGVGTGATPGSVAAVVSAFAKAPADAGSGAAAVADARVCAAWPDPVHYQRHVFWCDPASEALDELGAAAYVDHHRQRQAAWQEPLFQALLADFQLSDHMHKPLLGLSMGMRRKLRLVCAVASGAPLTLMDEPLAALDRHSAATVADLLADCAAATQRIFVTTAHESPDPTWGARALHLPDRLS